VVEKTGPAVFMEKKTMPLNKLLESQSFDPADMQVMRAAFDNAWEEIAPKLSSSQGASQAARNKLADTVIHVARTTGVGTPHELTAKVLEAMNATPTKI
jgi:hypothetical protein